MTPIPAGWKPISSAPKDGTPVLLFARHIDAEASTRVVGWFNADYGWIAQSYIGQPFARLIPSQWAELLPFPGSPAYVAPGDAQDERQAFDQLPSYITDDRYHLQYRLGWNNCLAGCRAAILADAPAAGGALAALRELVECDSLKKRIASMQVCVLETEDDVQELDAIMSDLARRQPAAWDAARAALAAQVPQQGEA